jgi:hypothetical protein
LKVIAFSPNQAMLMNVIRVKHGGVCLLVRNELVDICCQVTINSVKHYNGIFWCIIGSILFGVMYILPAGSVNLDVEIFEHI